MATPRKLLVDQEAALYYHITSRCVQQAWLLGNDRLTRRNFDHRKGWLVRRIEQIAPAFAVAIQTYAIMSNHFHLVVYYDPLACKTWSDEEVARRWFIAHPAQIADPEDDACRQEAIDLLLDDKDQVEHCRASLGSLSEFMKCLKQPIAARANKESDTEGDFWSGRFYSGVILSERALLTTMAYVDLNPVRAKIVEHIEACEFTGISDRLRDAELNADVLEDYLAPCFSGLANEVAAVATPLTNYRQFLNELLGLSSRRGEPSKHMRQQTNQILTRAERWRIAQSTLAKRPRAIGNESQVSDWLSGRGFTLRDALLPEGLA